MEDRVGELRDEGLLVVVGRGAAQLLQRMLGDLHAGFLGQHDDAHEQRDGDPAQHGQCRRRVARLRFPEGRYTVADRLDSGQRRAARREGPRDKEYQGESEDLAVVGVHLEIGRLGLQRCVEEMDLEEPPAEHGEDAEHERVGGNGERGARLPDAAQVDRRQQQDGDHREQHLVMVDERHRRADVRHRRGHRHGHREHVVHQQRAGHGQPRGRAEVGGDHLVVATARRVRMHVLPVACDHDEHDPRDRQPDPGRHRIGRQARHRQHQEDLLRCVRHRGQCIGGEHRQGDPLGQQRVRQLVAAERLA